MKKKIIIIYSVEDETKQSIKWNIISIDWKRKAQNNYEIALRTNRETHCGAWIGIFICESYSNITWLCGFFCHQYTKQLKFKALVINEQREQLPIYDMERKNHSIDWLFERKTKKTATTIGNYGKSSLNWKKKAHKTIATRMALLKWLFELAEWYHRFMVEKCFSCWPL